MPAEADGKVQEQQVWVLTRGIAHGIAAALAIGLGVFVVLLPLVFPEDLGSYAATVGSSAVGFLLVITAVLRLYRKVNALREEEAEGDKDRARSLARAKIDGYRATFDEVAKRAAASEKASTTTPSRDAFIKDVRQSFGMLKSQIDVAANDEEIEILCDSAEELERLRAYIIPKQEIVVDARTKLADMHEWDVPNAILDKLTIEAVPMLSSRDDDVARAALRTVYENYDYWDWYVEKHASTMRIAGGVLLALMLASLTGAVFLLHATHVYSGVFCAGLAGALLSVVAKLPPVMGYGDANAYVGRIMSRVGVGVASSMIGIGLLASNIISIQLPGDTVSVAGMLNGDDLDGTTPPAASTAEDADEIAEKVAARIASPGGTATAGRVGTDDSVGTPAAAAEISSTVAGAIKKGHFSKRAVLLILAVAMLFGFSERALFSFENKVVPGRVLLPGNGVGDVPRDGDAVHRGPCPRTPNVETPALPPDSAQAAASAAPPPDEGKSPP